VAPALDAAATDYRSWASHIEDFPSVRAATLIFFRNPPDDMWLCSGIASDNRFTVRALAYILAGHLIRHTAIIRERYL